MAHSRRRFLKTAGVAIAGATLFDVDQLFASPPYVRRDVGGGSAAADIASYATAVAAMKALPTTDPLSWTYQAAIHGTTLSGSHTAWNTCQHGTNYFLSWHRMYLYWFERIIRKKSGNANFALPFWNYESASERTLPMPFRNSASALYLPDSQRGSGWNSGAASLGSGTVSTSAAMSQTAFEGIGAFSNLLEGTPHAAVHNAFGSTGGIMGGIDTAALDPIFYLHHCNIDRLWNAWLAQGGGRSDPLGDAAWKSTPFTFFDENGHQVTMTGCDILRAQEQLGYYYEGEPPQVKEYCLRLPPWWWRYIYEVLLPCPPIKIGPGPDPGPIDIDIRQLSKRLLTLAEDKNTDVVLTLTDVVADRQPNVYWEVYAGLPKGAAAVPEGPHFVGNLAIFGGGVRTHEGHGTNQTAQFGFRLDEAIRASATRNEGTLSLRFVARGAQIKGVNAAVRSNATVSIGKVSIDARRSEQQKTITR